MGGKFYYCIFVNTLMPKGSPFDELKKSSSCTASNYYKWPQTFVLNLSIQYHFDITLSLFVSALYSKAKGQYLRVALPMHALFLGNPLPEELPKQIPESVIKAAVSLVNLCIQHTAIIAGREVTNGQIGKSTEQQISPIPPCHTLSDDDKLQQFVLTQPGSIISATRMTNVSKFRSSGGKQKVLMVFTAIVQKNLATVQHKKNNVSS